MNKNINKNIKTEESNEKNNTENINLKDIYSELLKESELKSLNKSDKNKISFIELRTEINEIFKELNNNKIIFSILIKMLILKHKDKYSNIKYFYSIVRSCVLYKKQYILIKEKLNNNEIVYIKKL